jgi:hypothetical protein
MPGLLDKTVARVKSRGVPEKSAYPIAVAALQRAGDLKAGSLKPTAKGTARNKMTAAQRAKTRG